MRIDLLTLFPEPMSAFLSFSILGRAQQAGVVRIVCSNIRDFAGNKHNKVDDAPFGGGPGMVLRAAPVVDCVEAVEAQEDVPAVRLLMSPQGQPLTQAVARELASLPRLLIIAGHYEGIDERAMEILRPREISIGDYVLSGGEVAAAVLIDAVVRLLPGALGDDAASQDESFSHGLLEYPHYTRPREYRGLSVPEVLLNGNHAQIDAWRREQSQLRTALRRPDLLEGGR